MIDLFWLNIILMVIVGGIFGIIIMVVVKRKLSKGRKSETTERSATSLPSEILPTGSFVVEGTIKSISSSLDGETELIGVVVPVSDHLEIGKPVVISTPVFEVEKKLEIPAPEVSDVKKAAEKLAEVEPVAEVKAPKEPEQKPEGIETNDK